MKIKIAHLYYDLLNLYGEEGNIIALKSTLEKQNVSYQLDYLTVNDKIKFNNYDIIYLGAGSDDNLEIVLNDILKYKDSIKKAIENNIYFIVTGNSHELFGQSLEINNKEFDGLKIFPYFAKKNNTRIVGESFMQFNNLSPIIGFQNRANVLQIKENHLFKVLKGSADNFKSDHEGIHYNNFFGTYLLGPLLIRNPHFTDYIIRNIFTKKNISYQEINDTYDYKAYSEYIKNFYEQS